MAKIDETGHKKISNVLSDSRISPSVLAYQMLRENLYLNEALLEYMISYVYLMADTKLIPFHLQEVQKACKYLKSNMEELGLSELIYKEDTSNAEYLVV